MKIYKMLLKNKKFFLVLILILILGSGVVYFLIPRKKNQSLTYLVKKCDVVQTVSVTGSLKSSQEVDLAFQSSGQIEKIYVQEGEEVKKGALLAKLNDGDILAKIKEAQAAVNSVEERLVKMKKGAREEEKEFYQAKIESSRKKLKEAEDNLENTKIISERKLKNLYQGVYQLILESFANANDAFNRKLDPLFKNEDTNNLDLSFNLNDFQLKNDLIWKRKVSSKILSQWQILISQLSQDSSREDLDKNLAASQKFLSNLQKVFPLARNALNKAVNLDSSDIAAYKDLVNLGESEVISSLDNIINKIQSISLQKDLNEKSLASAQDAYNLAKANLILAEKEFVLKTSPARPEDLKSVEADLEKARADLNYYIFQLRKTKIIAPADGIITEVLPAEKEFVNSGQKIIGFIGKSGQEIEVNVSESDIAKIEIGDKALVDFDALGPQKKFEAEVVKINPSSTIISGVVYYKIKLYLKKSDPRLKPGMTANIDIFTDEKKNVLCLPYQFIEEKNHKKFVYLKRAKGLEEREIQTGLEGEQRVEILSGLKEGDEVVINFFEK